VEHLIIIIMNFDRTGIILYVINYQECVHFYENVLELKIMFSTEMLTCFAFESSYLMVELDDTYDGSEEIHSRIKTCLRMHVPDVKSIINKLKIQDIEVNYQEHSWGTIAKFYDPDGNLCAFKDSSTFEKQIEEYK